MVVLVVVLPLDTYNSPLTRVILLAIPLLDTYMMPPSLTVMLLAVPPLYTLRKPLSATVKKKQNLHHTKKEMKTESINWCMLP